jgi:hypothetical protein
MLSWSGVFGSHLSLRVLAWADAFLAGKVHENGSVIRVPVCCREQFEREFLRYVRGGYLVALRGYGGRLPYSGELVSICGIREDVRD